MVHLQLLQMMFFLTMVFQAQVALTILPLAQTDAALKLLVKNNEMSAVGMIGQRTTTSSWHILSSLQRCHGRGQCHRWRVPTTQQDREIQRAESDKGCRRQEAVPEILNVVKIWQNVK